MSFIICNELKGAHAHEVPLGGPLDDLGWRLVLRGTNPVTTGLEFSVSLHFRGREREAAS